MTAPRYDVERVLDAFLADGPTAVPDRAIEAALDRVAVLGQRRRPLRLTLHARQATLRLLLAAALAIVTLLAGLAIVGTQPPKPQPTFGPSPDVSPRTSPASSAAAADPYRLTISRAINQLDHAAGAAESSLAISGADNSALLQFVDGMSGYLDVGDLASVRRLLGELEAKVAAMAPSLDAGGPTAAAIRRTVATLDHAVNAQPLTSGPLSPGPYRSTTFEPIVVVDLPAGWSRRAEDSEALALLKGNVSLAFSHSSAAVTPDVPHAGACWHLAPAASCLPPDVVGPPAATAPGGYSGWVTHTVARVPMAIWSTAALQSQFTYVAPAGDDIWTWVVDARGTPLTIDLSGPPGEVAAVLPEVEAMLEDFLAA